MPFLRTILTRSAFQVCSGPRSFVRHASKASHGLSVSQDRLWETIQSTCDIAGAKNGGLSRLSCDDNDKIARDWFANEVKSLGCKYEVDAMGSQWATIEGENNDLPPIGVGSHLDSVQTGGKFDGPLGVRHFRHVSLD